MQAATSTGRRLRGGNKRSLSHNNGNMALISAAQLEKETAWAKNQNETLIRI